MIMDIKFSAAALPKTGFWVLPVQADKKLPAVTSKALGATLTKTVETVLKSQTLFTGEKEQFLPLHGLSGTSILLYGVGKPADFNSKTDSLKIGGLTAAQGKTLGASALHVVLTAEADAQQFATGAGLRAYKFADYKTKSTDKNGVVKNLIIHTKDATKQTGTWKANQALVNGVYLARDLMNQPPNICTPANFVKQVKAAFKGLNVTITALDEKGIAKNKMGALQAVARGNRNDPYVLAIEYKGSKKAGSKPLALIGKGVTFDTGGYNIKPGVFTGGSMGDMKYDMGGAAAVVGTMLALARGKAPVHAVGVVGLTENMIDEDSYLPSEVITTMSGQTVEVMDTDAEGRLVLADVITYTQKYHKPKTIIDIATLTGSALVALGTEYCALFSNDDKLADRLFQAGQDTGERCWRMPIDAAPNASLKSSVADMVNVELSRLAGASFAALFISQFVDKDVNWAHLDIAGTMKARTDLPICPAGGMGYGVRLMHEYALKHG